MRKEVSVHTDDVGTVLKAAASLTVVGLGLWGGRYMMQAKEHRKSAEVQEKVAAQGQAASLEGQLTTSRAAGQQAAHDLEVAKERITDLLRDLDEVKERIVELLVELRNRNNEVNRLEDAQALDQLLKEDLLNEVDLASEVSDRLRDLVRKEAAAKTVAVDCGAQLQSQVEALQTRLDGSIAAEVAARQELQCYQDQVSPSSSAAQHRLVQHLQLIGITPVYSKVLEVLGQIPME
ncbi:hypothetical protein ABBQ32_007960 [Trebouxia sp. C0010 RCD-2024]